MDIRILRTFELQLHPQLTIYIMFENTAQSVFYRLERAYDNIIIVSSWPKKTNILIDLWFQETEFL